MIRAGLKSIRTIKFLVIAAFSLAFSELLVYHGLHALTSSTGLSSESRLKLQEEGGVGSLLCSCEKKTAIEKEILRSNHKKHLKPSTTVTRTTDFNKPQTWIKHRTFLKTRIKCNQRFPLLILVPSSPLNFQNRKVIRQTWGTDHNMNKTWKTMFLLGQAQHPTENKYLMNEATIHGDLVQGSQIDSYYNLTLKVEMGLEWAVTYCDFDFLLKADDDVFINPFRLIDHLRSSQMPKSKLYLGNCFPKRAYTKREGKWALSYKEYPKELLPRFCSGPAYVLSRDLVRVFVDVFDTRQPLKLEDVYIATLVKRLGVKPRHHRGFKTNVYNGKCIFRLNLIALHEASLKCVVKLFNYALQQRFREMAYPEKEEQEQEVDEDDEEEEEEGEEEEREEKGVKRSSITTFNTTATASTS